MKNTRYHQPPPKNTAHKNYRKQKVATAAAVAEATSRAAVTSMRLKCMFLPLQAFILSNFNLIQDHFVCMCMCACVCRILKPKQMWHAVIFFFRFCFVSHSHCRCHFPPFLLLILLLLIICGESYTQDTKFSAAHNLP